MEQSYETINIGNNSKGLLFVLEKEYLNSLDNVVPQYSIASSSIRHDPRLTNNIDINDQDIVKIFNTNIDFEIVKVNTLFYCINNRTDSLGWQYNHYTQVTSDDCEEKGEAIIESGWSANCKDKNLRRRLWVLQIIFPFERDEIQLPHYEVSETFESILLFSKESIDIKVQECENTLSDYESWSIEIYYRFIKIFSKEKQSEQTFSLSNHTRVNIFHDSLQPFSIQIADREFNIIIAMTSVIDVRKIFSLLSHILDVIKRNEKMTSSTYLRYHNPTNGPNAKFPLLYSDLLVVTVNGPKQYSLRLFSHRIELYNVNNSKHQTHSLYGSRLYDTGKLDFKLEFEHSKDKIITISFRCLNFKSKRLWIDSISQTITMNNRIERESFEKEFQRTMDIWGAISDDFQHQKNDIINIRQSKCRVDAENDLLELIRIQRQDTSPSIDLGLTRISSTKCCIIL